jgi:PilZ domain
MQEEERTSVRRRVLKGAIAAFNLRHSTIPCTIRDLSDTGCRVIGTDILRLPDTFELMLELDGLIMQCEVVRRKSDGVGVRFLGPAQPYTPKRAQIIAANVPNKVSIRKAVTV